MSASSVSSWISSGRGLVGNGCVGDRSSPGRSEAATGRSSIGQIGAPVSRLKVYAKPCFVVSTTMGVRRPSMVTSIRTGALGLSKFQMSWCTIWKCHARLPVFTSSASRLVPNRLSPGRKPPKKSMVGGLVGM